MEDQMVLTTARIHNVTKTPYGLRWALDVNEKEEILRHLKYSHFFNSEKGWNCLIKEMANLDVPIAGGAGRYETAQRIRKLCKGWKVVVGVREHLYSKRVDILFVRRDYSVDDWS